MTPSVISTIRVSGPFQRLERRQHIVRCGLITTSPQHSDRNFKRTCNVSRQQMCVFSSYGLPEHSETRKRKTYLLQNAMANVDYRVNKTHCIFSGFYEKAMNNSEIVWQILVKLQNVLPCHDVVRLNSVSLKGNIAFVSSYRITVVIISKTIQAFVAIRMF